MSAHTPSNLIRSFRPANTLDGFVRTARLLRASIRSRDSWSPTKKPPQCSCNIPRKSYTIFHRGCSYLIVGPLCWVFFYLCVVMIQLQWCCQFMIFKNSLWGVFWPTVAAPYFKNFLCAICSISQRWMFISHTGPNCSPVSSAARVLAGFPFCFKVFKSPNQSLGSEWVKGWSCEKGTMIRSFDPSPDRKSVV